MVVDLRWEPLDYMLLNGLSELAQECWSKLELEFLGTEFSPNWQRYRSMEEGNNLRFLGMRKDNDLVGYASVEIYEDIHRSGVKVASIMDIYITPHYRGYAGELINFIEDQMVSLAVNRLMVAERFNFDHERGGVGKFYEFMGFAPQECLWAKNISNQRVQ